MYERRNGIIYYVADGKHLPPVTEQKPKSSPKRDAGKKSKKK